MASKACFNQTLLSERQFTTSGGQRIAPCRVDVQSCGVELFKHFQREGKLLSPDKLAASALWGHCPEDTW